MGIEIYFEKFGARIDTNALSAEWNYKQTMEKRLWFLCGAITGTINDKGTNLHSMREVQRYIREYQRIYAYTAEFGMDTQEIDNETNIILINAGYNPIV